MLAEIKSLLAQPGLVDILKKDSPAKRAVTTLQQMLYELGYGQELRWQEFGADGDFGGATAAAIRAFAARNGLESDGESVDRELAGQIVARYETVADVRRVQALLDAGTVERQLFRGSPHQDSVRALQRLLNGLGFGAELKWATFGADGDYGSATAAAVGAFAQREGLTADGEKADTVLCEHLLAQFTPFLGDDWRTVSSVTPADNSGSARPDATPTPAAGGPVRRRARKSQYERLYPVIDRTFAKIAQELPAYQFTERSHPIPGEETELHFVEVLRKDNDASYFFHQEIDKQRVVLHFTAGQISGDIKTLTTKDREVSTLFTIGRDGTIYKLFPNSKFWSWHLGRGAVGGNTFLSKSSIGIEISNWGPLREDGRGGLVTFEQGHWYCTLEQTDAYVEVSQPYRGARYFAAITPEQYESVILSLRYLTKSFDIPTNFLPAGQRDQVFPGGEAARRFSGITCHTNYRDSGKWDLCEEAFDWARVIAGVQADTFEPELTQAGTRSFGDGPIPITEAAATEAIRGMYSGSQDPDKYGEDGPEVDI
jgi:peptidoglycan hydrolase-like protein with peptidoglycan-binding domain